MQRSTRGLLPPIILAVASAAAFCVGAYMLLNDSGSSNRQSSFNHDGLRASQDTWWSHSSPSTPTYQDPLERHANKRVNPVVYFSVEIGRKSVGELYFELFSDETPNTADNFLKLSTGEHGFGFQGSTFHRVISGFMAQGGDFTNGDGTGGRPVHGSYLRDENFTYGFTGRGILAMANHGPNTGTSQFFITFDKTEWLNGKHVIFGRLVDGWDVLDLIEEAGTQGGHPSSTIVITKSGETTWG